MPAISVLVKPASGNCNLHCDYCFYCDEAAKRQIASYGMMNDQTLKNVIRRTLLRAEGYYSIMFQGGEPTLNGLSFYQKAVEYIHQYNKNHCRIQIGLQTNGYTLNEDWCRFLSQNHILTGISIDGLPQIHNQYRHPRDGGISYDHCLNSTRLMDQYGVEYNVLCVIHRQTALHIREIYHHFRSMGWDYMQFITCLDPLHEPRGSMEYSLTPELYGQFLIDLFDLWYVDFMKGNPPFIRQFENYAMILAGQVPEACEHRGQCGIQYVVEADGSVYPCDFYVLDDMKLGNFNTDRMPDIDNRRKEVNFIQRSLTLPQECRKCRWLRLCRGACYRSRFTQEDQAMGLGPEGMNYFCKGYQMFFEACYDRLQTVVQIAMERQNG